MAAARAAILHVEDDPSLQRLVRLALEQSGGYIVLSAGSGAEALAFAAQIVPQIVLLDIDLPDMNGLALLKQLRGVAGYAAVPTILLTSVREPGAQAELDALGVRELLRKPFSPRLLGQVIDRVLAMGAG